MDHTKNKIHVLFLPLWYPNKYDPMPGLFIRRHIEAVSQYCKVSVLYLHPDINQKEKYQLEYTEEPNIDTAKLYYRQTKNSLPLLSNIIKGINFLKAAYYGYREICKNNEKPQIAHVNVLTRLGLFALILKYLYGLPYIITEHWSRYQPHVNTYKGIIRKLITRIVIKRASAVTTVSNDLKNAMLRHNLKNHIYYITPNVVDTNLFIRFKRNQKNKIKQIVHVSCFDDQPKNISGILRVIKRLSESRDDFKCLMVGDGPDFERIKSYASSLEINSKFVQFLGLKEEKELVNIINQSDFMLLFSNYENFPVVITESFSCGLPVVSTSVGGIPEHLTSDKGILVKVGDEKQLLQALHKMLENLSEYDSEKLRQYAIDHFSYPVVGKQFYNIYKKALSS